MANRLNGDKLGTDEKPPELPTPGCFKNVSDRILKANAKLLENPYDIEAWKLLIKDAQPQPIDYVREFYERMVDRFSTSGRFWKIYIEHEIAAKNYEAVEKLFKRCLIRVLNIDLWKCYLRYIKETKFLQVNYRESMGQAYDFALDNMGIDINSCSIYADYVSFLKNVDAKGNYAENQKISAVRRVYQRGIVIPMSGIETFWKEYLNYEQSINQMFVDKAISDRSKDYMNARRVVKEFEVITRGLNRNLPAVPPSGKAEERRQAELWKKFIAWEKTNPLKTEDHHLVIRRVVFAYEQCLLCLGHHPDIWYEYGSYLEKNSKFMAEKGDMNRAKALQEDVANVYERATSSLLKENVLLHFCHADFEESRNRKDDAIRIYEKLLHIESEDFDPTLIYVQYMKFTRRTESITSARVVFKRAREDRRCGSDIYKAAALMEYYCSKDINIACKIFELGLKKFPSDVTFILAYIDFLSHLNEENNIRVLFERVLSSDALPLERSMEIWNKFLEFESQIGDLPSVVKVERRRAAVLEKMQQQQQQQQQQAQPELSETAWIVDRYRFGSLMPCSMQVLKSIGYAKLLKSGGGAGSLADLQAAAVSDMDDKMTEKPVTYMPNLTQVVPFKPMPNPVGNLMPGGIFSYPPSVVNLLAQIPPPQSFRGPFVNVEELLSVLIVNPQVNLSNARDCLLPPAEAKAYLLQTIEAAETFGQKRERGTGGGHTNTPAIVSMSASAVVYDEDEEGDGEGSNLMPPQFDIYRSRQMNKKIKVAN